MSAEIDKGISTLANELLRVHQFERGWRNRMRASCHTLRNGFHRSWWKSPFALMGALTSLSYQELQRTIVVLCSARARLWPDFFGYVIEVFNDLEVYFSLRYGDDLVRRKAHLETRPNDVKARLDYGRTLMKCGLFQEAAHELEKVAQEAKPKIKRRALYECQVAYYKLGDFNKAIEAGVACLDLRPNDPRPAYWLWQASHKVGGYPDHVPESYRMSAAAGFEPTEIELEEVAAEIGLDKTSGGRGTAIFDSNGDGYLDVVIAGAHAGCSFFRNNGDGTFTDISPGSGLDKCLYAFSVAVGDYNNDGLPDLFICGLGFFDGQGALMRNNGDGTFTDVTEEAGLEMWGPAFTSSWVDYDNNGHLDLFVANHLGGLFDRKVPNRLYYNNGDGTFTEVSAAAGLNTEWTSLGHAWGDFNNNGLPDLFVSNFGRSQLFQNNGDGTFTDVSRKAGVDRLGIGSVCLWCDIDNDGWLDLVQFTYSRPQDAILSLQTGRGPDGKTSMRVYRNNRDGTFTDIADDLGLDGCWGTMSAAAGDLTNNGCIDLLLGNGDPSMDRTEPALLFEGGDERFQNTTFSAGMPFTGKGHGVNMADLTGEGRLHLIVGAGGLYPGDLLTTTVHRPKERTGNYLNVRLVGVDPSSRDAIGARVRLRSGGRDQHRLVSGGSGFGCMPFEQHFGLGTEEEIEHLEIRWPSGRQQLLESPPVNQTISITEGEDGFEFVYKD